MPDTPEEWVEAVRAVFDGRDGQDGRDGRDGQDGLSGPGTLTGSVQVDVTGGPDGDLSMYADFDRGHLSGAGVGPADGPDVTLSLTASDARGVLAGSLDPNVAFMQGRMKVTGEMGLVLDLLALAATDDFRARREQVAELSPR